MTDTAHVVGYVVVQSTTTPGRPSVEKVISRRYTVKAAAEQFAAMAHAAGRDVWVRDVLAMSP